eukprot:TRINITY_DN6655_c0_g1_i1.p1 TRINITY_DN6655_c0_g1~~TRINITY_DN6655_c0_g1_i1.p1  ORF type:complete len:167 (+),score=27.25 TRINITY_DN6655_c0_g1_i1:915-1415(+)
MDKIEEGLYLGNYSASRQRSALLQLNVKHIVQVANDLGPPPFPKDFVYTVVEISDSIIEPKNISHHFDRCFDAIATARARGEAVLVHCVVGMSRSATIVIGYLMKTRNMSLPAAFSFVKSIRPIVQPNSKFMQELRKLDARLEAEREAAKDASLGTTVDEAVSVVA